MSLLVVVVTLLTGLLIPAELQGSVEPDHQSLRFTEFESGEARTLEHHRGKIVILNFWATWCKPCVEELPLLVSIQERYASRGVQVVAISADEKDTQSQIKSFLQRFSINFPVWVGGTTQHMEELGLGRALPATAILDQTGKIVGRIMGQAAESDLTRYVDWLLDAPPDSINKLGEETAPQADEHEHDDQSESHRHGEVGPEGASSVPS